jgi:hypothetical protein
MTDLHGPEIPVIAGAWEIGEKAVVTEALGPKEESGEGKGRPGGRPGLAPFPEPILASVARIATIFTL